MKCSINVKMAISMQSRLQFESFWQQSLCVRSQHSCVANNQEWAEPSCIPELRKWVGTAWFYLQDCVNKSKAALSFLCLQHLKSIPGDLAHSKNVMSTYRANEIADHEQCSDEPVALTWLNNVVNDQHSSKHYQVLKSTEAEAHLIDTDHPGQEYDEWNDQQGDLKAAPQRQAKHEVLMILNSDDECCWVVRNNR